MGVSKGFEIVHKVAHIVHIHASMSRHCLLGFRAPFFYFKSANRRRRVYGGSELRNGPWPDADRQDGDPRAHMDVLAAFWTGSIA